MSLGFIHMSLKSEVLYINLIKYFYTYFRVNFDILCRIYYHFYKTMGLKNQKLIWIQMSTFTLEEEKEEVVMKKLPILFSKKCTINYTYTNGQLRFLWKKLNNCSLLEFLQRGMSCKFVYILHETKSVLIFWLVLKLDISYRVIIFWRILVSFR